MSRVAPDFSGMIPLDVIEAQSAGVRRLVGGVADLAAVSGGVLEGIRTVRDAGQWADAREGLYRFERDTMGELESSGDVDGLRDRWQQALEDKLPSYLPSNLSDPVKERVDMVRRKLAESGDAHVEKIARLGQVEQARQSWAGGVQAAVEQGDADLAGQRVLEGDGLFVTHEEALQMTDDVRMQAGLHGALQEVRKDPAAALPIAESKKNGGELNVHEQRVLVEAGIAYDELRKRYADSIFRSVSGGGLLRDDGLSNAERHGLVSSEQLTRYAAARDREWEALGSQVSVPVDDELICRMTALIDEDSGGESDADVLIEVATSGLPARELARLAARRETMMQVPQEVRKAASRRLSSMFRNGAWGPASDAVAVEEWKRVQLQLSDAVGKNPANAVEELNKVFDQENRMQDAGWVGFNDMKNKQKGIQR